MVADAQGDPSFSSDIIIQCDHHNYCEQLQQQFLPTSLQYLLYVRLFTDVQKIVQIKGQSTNECPTKAICVDSYV